MAKFKDSTPAVDVLGPESVAPAAGPAALRKPRFVKQAATSSIETSSDSRSRSSS